MPEPLRFDTVGQGLTPEERDAILSGIRSFIRANPAEALASGERDDLRSSLADFLDDHPLRWGLEPASLPLPLWSGVNLFSRLQPFALAW